MTEGRTSKILNRERRAIYEVEGCQDASVFDGHGGHPSFVSADGMP